ncbi:MAG: leucine-rich repeat domain-containing protein, partial [Clostridia bacterium]|nr:leucine-rich repeat domain-containing protein [Clostridia bacterium]
HTFGNTWEYKDATGHAHVCEYCGVHDTVVGHTPNVDAATEDTAKYCTFCGYVIEQQLNHVHSEGTEWKYDSEYHWHDCVGNDGQVYSKAEHTYDNACDTTCNVCNATRTITHDYTKLEKNDTEHWYVCSVCGSEKANSRTGHSGGTKDCQHKAECATCGQTYGDFGDHAYDTTVWVSVGDLNHAHKCKHCDAYTDETEHFSLDEATYTEDKLCDACGHKMADALGFELNNVVYKILTNEEGNYTVEVYGNTLTEATDVTIPATVISEGIEYLVVSIGENAFRNNGYITGVYISEGVISIAKSAFESCSELKYANLPESIETLGIGVFCNCAQLSYVNIPSNVKVIEEWTFNGCHVLEGITIPDGVTHIGYRAFYNCFTLTDITVPYSVEAIGNYAFYGCTGLEQMTIHAQKATIGNNSIPTEVGTVYCDGAESTVAEYCARNGVTYYTHEGEHVDKNTDHACDYGCSITIGVCEDSDLDHECDYGCTKTFGGHADGNDGDHFCDYGCQEVADSGCYDSGPVDGSCDECGAPIEHDHTGGNATCTEKAVCMICGQSYGEFAEHTFGNTWEYKDATGHAHVCTVKGCNEHDEIKAHTPNIPAATEESAQYCTACQYQMAAQLNHTHSPATE